MKANGVIKSLIWSKSLMTLAGHHNLKVCVKPLCVCVSARKQELPCLDFHITLLGSEIFFSHLCYQACKTYYRKDCLTPIHLSVRCKMPLFGLNVRTVL